MTVKYPCPLRSCAWFYSHAATPATADVPTDILLWTQLNWADMAERTGPGLTAAQVVDAHLVTHSPVQWMGLACAERDRAESVTAERDRLRIVVEKTAFFTEAVDPLTTRRLPSRAEIEAVQALLADAAGGNADA